MYVCVYVLVCVYRCSTKENLDPTMVKVDERKKVCLTTERFIDYYNS